MQGTNMFATGLKERKKRTTYYAGVRVSPRDERAYGAGDERGGIAEHRGDDDLRGEPGDLAAALGLALVLAPVRVPPSPAGVAALRRAPDHRRHPVPAAAGHHHVARHPLVALLAPDGVPALDEHVHDARHVEAVAPALAPVAPAAAAVPAAVARGARAGVRVQVQPDPGAGVQRVRQRGAARVQVEAAGAAVVDVAGHVAAARVAVARPRAPRRARQEHERAARVERVPQRRRRRQRALPVQVVVAARVRAAETRPDAHLAAPIAPERRLRVLQPETVLRVAQVRQLAVPHFWLRGWLWARERERGKCLYWSWRPASW
jgi:hypothetical protein